ncbi:hypothetical protein HC928_19690, partial [bacterium]|nr:hypothetical protein [bacterium]
MSLRNHPTPSNSAAPSVTPPSPTTPTILAREFNLLVPENAMKCGTICAQPDTYDFTAADTITHFAQQHQQALRGHTLCWHLSFAPWMKNSPPSNSNKPSNNSSPPSSVAIADS